MAATDLLVEVGLPGSATTLDSNYTTGDSTVTVVATTNWPSTGKAVIFAIDEATVVDGEEVQTAGTYNEFEGTVASATSISNVDQVAGSGDRNYTAGSLTRVYIPVSSERENRIVEWGSAEHNVTDGTHSDITADSINVTDVTITGDLTVGGVGDNGWVTTGGTHSVATTYNAGNRSFEIDTSTDLSSIVSPGMRYRVTRNTTPPTQCADLESGSTQYASKSSPTGITFTDDFTCEAWVKLESYGTESCIVSRWDGTTGFYLTIQSTGTVRFVADQGASTDNRDTYQSIPLNKWVHIASTMDASGDGGVTYIDGVSVPVNNSSTAATALVQAGNLQVGARNATVTFDGKIADVRVWSDIRTATEIQDNMYAYPSDTTGLVAHFKLNGDFTDASSNGNDLTAQNSAVATDTDNPWNATEYGIITAVSASTIQVFCPSGYGIPNETLTAPFYSTQSAPFGFPRGRDKWAVEFFTLATNTKSSPSSSAQHSFGIQVLVPIGSWKLSYLTNIYVIGTGTPAIYMSLSNDNTARDDRNTTLWAFLLTAFYSVAQNSEIPINISSEETWYLVYNRGGSPVTSIAFSINILPTYIKAECAYL